MKSGFKALYTCWSVSWLSRTMHTECRETLVDQQSVYCMFTMGIVELGRGLNNNQKTGKPIICKICRP